MARGEYRLAEQIEQLDTGHPWRRRDGRLAPMPFEAVPPSTAPDGPLGTFIPPGPEIDPADIPMESDFLAALGIQTYPGDEPDAGPESAAEEFGENLAEYLTQGDRDTLAQTIIDWVRIDKAGRAEWEDREALGIVALGVTREQLRDAAPATWRSRCVHPGLALSCINFWARAFGELWQGGKLAKTVVLGETTPESEQQAARVADYLNFLYSEEMPAAADELSRMLFRLPLSGSVFREAYFDPIEKTVVVEFVEAADLVKPYKSSDLRKAPRFTRIKRMTRNDLHRLEIEGYFLAGQVKNQPISETLGDSVIDAVIDDATGQRPGVDAGRHEAEFDNRDTLYECYGILNLEDYHWTDPLGERWGVPYLVTVHMGDQKTLSIRRNWRPSDPTKRRRLTVTEYKFLPGLDGYGFGLIHIAGDLAAALTGLTRYVMDGNTLDTQGRLSGWVSQDVVGAGDMPAFVLGQFTKIPQGSADELRKGFITPDFKWTPNNTLAIMEYLDKLMGALVSSTESVTGDENQAVAVGTTLARIEQRLKSFVSIFSLLHSALKRELRAVAELVADNTPPEGYPYRVEGQDQMILATDFSDQVDVIPASDPNVVTGAQRIAMAQLVEETVSKDPEVFGPRQRMEAHRNVLEAARVPNLDRFFPAANEPLPVEAAQAAQQQAMQAQVRAQQPDPNVPPPPDPVTADVQRRDAQAQAKIQATQAEIARKDAQAQAEIDAKAQAMQTDMPLQREGSAAVVQSQQDAEVAQLQQEILAAAREQQMANQYSQVGPENAT
jgi:hypothetical protein